MSPRPWTACRSSISIIDFWTSWMKPRASSLVVAVTPAPGANDVTVARAVRDTLARLQASLPASVEAYINYDRSVQIIESINDVKLTLLIAFALVVLVVFLFLGRVRETSIPIVALPLSLLLTFAVMWMLGYSLDNLSLMALTLAVGLLVDDAVVVLENTVRHLEEGKPATVGGFARSQGNQLHRAVDDPLFGCDFHPDRFHARADRPDVP